SYYDDSFYNIQCGNEFILVWIHVNDGVVTASLERVMRDFQAALESRLKTTWEGNLHNIFGIKVEWPVPSKIISLSRF
ncbi:uncharacterized protein VP01_9398g1, partial [Puccinia sorghi]